MIETLSDNHWRREGYTQRLTAKTWSKLLLEERDKIMFNGMARKLIAKNLGYGIVEISKEPLNTKDT